MNSSRGTKRHGEEEHIYPLKKQRIGLYLDDNRPIRTIKLIDIGVDVSADYLQGYFECYCSGPVSNVTIVKHKLENQEIRVAYVTFVVPEDAAKLICATNSRLNFKFVIKEAESIYQPKLDPNAFKFENIDDQCLSHIASYLDLMDIVNLGKASSRLRTFAEQIYGNKTHFSFDERTGGDSSINNKNVPTILEELGSYMRSIDWRYLNESQFVHLSQHCQNVTTLKLVNVSRHLQSSIERNKEFFTNIESLRIENAHFIDSQIKTIITVASKLKSLELVHCPNIKGTFFSEWKDSNLEYLKIANCESITPASICGFQRDNKLIKFSSDTFDSFISCLSLPSACLFKYTELELVLNLSTNEKLDRLKFNELKELKKINLKCTSFLSLLYERNYESSYHNFNAVFSAMGEIDTLTTITVERIIIDVDTMKCLGSIKNLQELKFKYVKNTEGRQLYSSIQENLPKITELSFIKTMTGEFDNKSICDMISSMMYLKYFAHCGMTWQLLFMILQVQLQRKQPRIEIGISPSLFYDPRKKGFEAISKGVVSLSLMQNE